MSPLHKMRIFLRELQKKSDEEKRRWIIALTAVSMVFVLAIWGLSLSATIKNLGGEPSTPQQNNFVATFVNGLHVIGGALTDRLSGLADRIRTSVQRTNSVTIRSTPFTVATTSIEAVTPHSFP
ncbi:hypothetical protein KGO95_04400 [Patescibacteria group bacterium]|nr:hypothetical protein [Patescibacteria group bacterium]